MNILLDTGFLRHLEYVGKLEHLEMYAKKYHIVLIMPNTVYEELQQLLVPSIIDDFLKRKIIKKRSCPKGIINKLKVIYGLGKGELGIIYTLQKLGDFSHKTYCALVDDEDARIQMGELGMGSLDSATFLGELNRSGLLNKDDTIHALNELDKIYDIETKSDIIQRLH